MKVERFDCKVGNSTKIILRECWFKKVDRSESDRVSVSLKATIIKPLTDVFAYTAAYYKYQTYKKFPVDYWDDICGWLNGRKPSLLMDWTLKRGMRYVEYGRELRCPLIGNFSFKFNNISLNEKFPIVPLFPAGQFLFETNLTEADRKTIIISWRSFVSISDSHVKL